MFGKKVLGKGRATIICTLLIFLAVAFTVAGVAVAEDKKPQFVWRVQTVHAPAETNNLIRPSLDFIEKASGGRLKFELFSGGEIVPDDQVFPAVMRGTIDMFHSLSALDAAPVDIGELDSWSPFMWQGPLEIMSIYYHRGMKELYEEAFNGMGKIKLVGVSSSDPIHLLSDRPIRTYEDLKGLKINTDRVIAPPYVKAGAVAVQLASSEFYLAGQTGIVDGLMWCGAIEGSANSWNEVFPYILENAVTGAAFAHWIANKKSYDKLPEDLQVILEMGLRDLAFRSMLKYYSGEPQARKNFTLTRLSNADMEKLKAGQGEVLDKIAKKSKRNAKLVKIFRDYNKEVDEANWYRCK